MPKVNDREKQSFKDRELQDILRKIPGVPLMYLHGKAPTLESPSEASREYARNVQKDLGMNDWEKENIKTLKRAAGIEENVEQKPKKKRKKGGPNPLSCLKKKKPKVQITSTAMSKKSGKVKKRKKIKIATHIKEALLTELKNKK